MRSGQVVLAGRPNVGKSTLVNALCEAKVAIVSDKPQTTRSRIQGVATGEDWQLVLVDLPGFQRPRDPLTERMQRVVNTSFEEVDGVCLVLSADEQIGAGDRFVAERAFSQPAPVVIALNKVDRLRPHEIARQIELAAALGDFRALHPVSARTGDGVAALRRELVDLLPEGPALLPARDPDRPAARAPYCRADPGTGARAHARGSAARRHGRGRRDRPAPRVGLGARRDPLAEADPRREGRQHDPGDRCSGPSRDRGAPRASGFPRPPGEGEGALAARPGVARTVGHVARRPVGI